MSAHLQVIAEDDGEGKGENAPTVAPSDPVTPRNVDSGKMSVSKIHDMDDQTALDGGLQGGIVGNLPFVESSSGDDSSVEHPGGSEVEDSDSESVSSRRRRGKRSFYKDLNDEQTACLNFAMENRIFIRAMLGLLNERDKKATEIGMNDPNTIKSGPLKKASHLVSGVWKVKFVEVRRGMFTYYEDAVSGDKSSGLLQKNVPLDYNSCSCRAVKIHRKGLNITTAGAIFEIKVAGTSRLWLAKSRDERHAWIQAINDAMVGGSVTRGGDVTTDHRGLFRGVNSKSPYKRDLKKYMRIKNTIKNAKTKHEYIQTIGELLGTSLDIPVKWIMEQVDSNPTSGIAGVFHEESITSGVEQLWKDLQRDSIKINDELIEGNSGGHAPEKMIGALIRIIIGTSRSSSAKRAISESRAFAYARDVLLSTNRTRSGGDSYFCIDTLCNNPNLIITVPSSREAEPLSISVALDDSEGVAGYSANDKTGWIRTKNRLQRSWRKRFFVLSEGTLSFYRNATPRPHGLRGQMVVTDASLDVSTEKGDFVVSIVTKDGLKDRFLQFKNEDKLLQWIYALECTAKGSSSTPTSGIKVFRKRQNPKESNKPHLESCGDVDTVELSMKKHVARLGLTSDGMEERIAHLSAKAIPNVKISVEAATEYKICTIDPQGDDGDTWAVISATFLQTFRIIGDRIVRGEEIVRVSVSECPGISGLEEETVEEVLSPTSARRSLGRMARNRAETS